MVSLTVNNQTEFNCPKKKLEKKAQDLLAKLELKGNYKISLAIVDQETIRDINKKWRNKAEQAGVLSFVENEIRGEFYEPEEYTYLGEIFLCPSYIKEKKSELEFKEEFLRYFKHGVFHLAGLTHEQMEKFNSGQKTADN